MTSFVLIPKDVAADIRVMLASIGQPNYLPAKDTPERRANAERLYRELLTARPAAKLLDVERERDLAIRNASDGWLYHCPDTGTEWSEQHPVESGEVPDAEDVRAATATAFLNELIPTWEALAEERALRKREGVKIAEVRKVLEALTDFVKHGNNAEGHCMCGSPMEGHDIYDNHSPVDMGEYHAEQLVKRAEAVLSGEAQA